ncbi:MAG: DUF1501 domain-containing protein [Acidimicrobiia bacterium]|nr:DUF1501 domain-containing protein [Acidimicrobiia bacterium]
MNTEPSSDPGVEPSRRLSRRAVLGMGGATGAAALGGVGWLIGSSSPGDEPVAASLATPMPTSAPPAPTPTPSVTGGRVLVIVQCGGGNDGLNTLVPADGRYHDARPAIGLADGDLVAMSGVDDFGLHPGLEPLTGLWDRGWLAPVAGIGMADQSRSHFIALESWWSGDPGTPFRGGWIGRWMDATLADDPDPLRAVALGGGSPLLAAMTSRSVAVNDPANFSLDVPVGVDQDRFAAAYRALADPLSNEPVIASAQAAIPSTLEAIDVLAGASAASGDDVRPASALLTTAASLIADEPRTSVVVINIGGFDTHAGQLAQQAPLLGDLGSGIAGFFDAVEASGDAERTLLITTSEFGRRVAENGSAGTDHGQASVGFVCGPGVSGGGVVGAYDFGNLVDGDLPVVVDTRSVYAAALDWLGGPTDEVLGGSWDRLGLLA